MAKGENSVQQLFFFFFFCYMRKTELQLELHLNLKTNCGHCSSVKEQLRLVVCPVVFDILHLYEEMNIEFALPFTLK